LPESLKANSESQQIAVTFVVLNTIDQNNEIRPVLARKAKNKNPQLKAFYRTRLFFNFNFWRNGEYLQFAEYHFRTLMEDSCLVFSFVTFVTFVTCLCQR
jgi:hypothetical protein